MTRFYQELDSPHFDYRIWPFEAIGNVWLRGPEPGNSPYRVACAGGAQTFGRFVDSPFPEQLAASLGCPVLNLGIGGAGPAFFLAQPILDALNAADVAVLQVVSGRSASNSRFQSLRGGILGKDTQSGERCELIDVVRRAVEAGNSRLVRKIVDETREDYVDSFVKVLRAIRKPTILLWFAPRDLDYTIDLKHAKGVLGPYPQLVDRAMVTRIAAAADAYVEVREPRGLPQRLWPAERPLDGAVVENGTLINRYYPSPEMHDAATRALDPVIRQLAANVRPPRVAPGGKSRPRRQKSFLKRSTGRLRRIRVDRKDLDPQLFPDFLVLGPQRTGTTWLAQTLNLHPNIFIPREKELYYFDRLHLEGRSLPHLRPGASAKLSWYLNFFEEPEAERAARQQRCRQLFDRDYEPRVRGEATASYAVELDDVVVDEILRINPGMRFLLMVRDPIERAWSHVKLTLAKARGRSLSDVPKDDILEFVSRPYQQRCGNFTEILAHWQALVPDESLMVVRYADISARPAELLQSVMRHVGVDPDEKLIAPQAARRINATTESPIPDDIRSTLESLYADELKKLRAGGWI